MSRLLWFFADKPRSGAWTHRWANSAEPLFELCPGSGAFLDCPTRVPGSGSPKTTPEDMTDWGDFAEIRPSANCGEIVLFSGSPRFYSPNSWYVNTEPVHAVWGHAADPLLERTWVLDASEDLHPDIDRPPFFFASFVAGREPALNFGVESVPTAAMWRNWEPVVNYAYGLHGRFGDAHKTGDRRLTVTEAGPQNCLISLREPDVISDPLLQSLLGGVAIPGDPADKAALATWRASCAAVLIGAGLTPIISASNMSPSDKAIVRGAWASRPGA